MLLPAFAYCFPVGLGIFPQVAADMSMIANGINGLQWCCYL